MTDKTIEEIASDAADTAAPDDATSPVSASAGDAPAAESVPAGERVAVTKASVADVEEAMKDVVDPELGINVVDLGLVYGSFVDDDNVVTLDMTLTSAACPLTDVIEDQTRQALTTGPGGGLVNDFRINWVWLPPWGPDKITDDGREQLRALGFNV
jgi:metal-sulfur cluster biosynthetic enzyme